MASVWFLTDRFQLERLDDVRVGVEVLLLAVLQQLPATRNQRVQPALAVHVLVVRGHVRAEGVDLAG